MAELYSVDTSSLISSGTKHTNNSCLVLIDIQNGFINGNTKHILERIPQLINSYSEACNGNPQIIATKFVNVEGSPFRNILQWHRLATHEETELAIPPCDHEIIQMPKTGYTAYFNTKEYKIGTVFLAGIDTDACVLTTAIDFFQHNIRPVVLEHYCASSGGYESHRAGLEVLRRTVGGGQIIYGEVDSKSFSNASYGVS